MYKELLWWNLLGNSGFDELYRNTIVINVSEIGEQIAGMCPDVNWMTVVSKGFESLGSSMNVNKFR
jgi:hypothetical protein